MLSPWSNSENPQKANLFFHLLNNFDYFPLSLFFVRRESISLRDIFFPKISKGEPGPSNYPQKWEITNHNFGGQTHFSVGILRVQAPRFRLPRPSLVRPAEFQGFGFDRIKLGQVIRRSRARAWRARRAHVARARVFGFGVGAPPQCVGRLKGNAPKDRPFSC